MANQYENVILTYYLMFDINKILLYILIIIHYTYVIEFYK